MALPVFTIQTFNQNTLQPAGAVFAQRVETISITRNFLAGITGTSGGRNALMEKKMADLTKALMEELQLQTKATYASAVALVDVKMHFSEIGKDESNMFLAGQASATALIKRNKVSVASPVAAPVASPVASPVAAPVASPVAAPMSQNSPVRPPMASPVSDPLLSKPLNQPAKNINSRISENKPVNPTQGGNRKYRSKLGKSRKNRL